MGEVLAMVAVLLLMTALGVWFGLVIAYEDERRRAFRSACDPDKETPPEGWLSPFARGLESRRRHPVGPEVNPYRPGTLDSLEWARGWDMGADQ